MQCPPCCLANSFVVSNCLGSCSAVPASLSYSLLDFMLHPQPAGQAPQLALIMIQCNSKHALKYTLHSRQLHSHQQQGAPPLQERLRQLFRPTAIHHDALASRHVSVATVSSPFARMSAPTICSLLNPMLDSRWNLRHDSAAQRSRASGAGGWVGELAEGGAAAGQGGWPKHAVASQGSWSHRCAARQLAWSQQHSLPARFMAALRANLHGASSTLSHPNQWHAT